MADPLGLRGRKKQQTRQLIAETAWQLFEKKGFEAVTVAEVARAADVAEKTVFNYFPTKEDLFFERLESFEQDLLTAVRGRPAGVTVLRAFRDFLLDRSRTGSLATRGRASAETTRRIRRFNRIMADSPALLAREQQIFRRMTYQLAEVISAGPGAPAGEVSSLVIAAALVGVHATMIDYVRRRSVAEDDELGRLGRDVRAQIKRAFNLLESGIRR